MVSRDVLIWLRKEAFFCYIEGMDNISTIVPFAILLVVGGIAIAYHIVQRQKEELERLSNELFRANEDLKKLDQAKSEFISIASHQLRTPLTVIHGYISLFNEGTLGRLSIKAQEVMDKMMLSAEQLIKLISDLLNLSRIESGKIKYEMKENDFIPLLEGVIGEFKGASGEKNISMECENRIGRTLLFSFDTDKMREVMRNLIDNAIKYSLAGKVVVTVERLSPPPMVRLSVRDHGIGIPQEDLARLFTKFGRTEESQKLEPNGMGIGLYFAKRVVEDHGGTIRAESEGSGAGSTFFVELPISA